jgi:TPR repeat protein
MGEMGLKQDKEEGLKWYHRAVEAGSGASAGILGTVYHEGDDVDKDDDKALEYFQKAADLIQSNIPTFTLISRFHMSIGEIEESMLNLRKAVMCGMSDDWLFEMLRNCFILGFITKDEYAYTLREHQTAYNEMESKSRERAKKVLGGK